MFQFLKKKLNINKDEIASLLNTNKEALSAFEDAYNSINEPISNNLFKVNAKQYSKMMSNDITYDLEDIVNRIVNELLSNTQIISLSEKESSLPFIQSNPVTLEEINSIPEEVRPELTGTLIKKDISGNSYEVLLNTYLQYIKETDLTKKQNLYGCFRQGLDILDLDSITYKIIGTNPNSMGYWLPKMIPAMEEERFFKIPETKIIKVPIPILQLTKLDYMSHTPTTLQIINRFCEKIFDLDTSKKYFIKTGTYSSKFDFRNALVQGEKEVKELGEYLLFIHSQAIAMAHYDLSGHKQPIIYGVSTTNEWVVREFIEDAEENLTIYHGLPLRTEYRAFVDFDTKEVLGIHPYWDPDLMKKTFERRSSEDIDAYHDYIAYTANESRLMERYNQNKDKVVNHLKNCISNISLHGQWSIDIMQNGNDFWFIDMAIAENSAFYNECVAIEDRRPSKENWIPDLS